MAEITRNKVICVGVSKLPALRNFLGFATSFAKLSRIQDGRMWFSYRFMRTLNQPASAASTTSAPCYYLEARGNTMFVHLLVVKHLSCMPTLLPNKYIEMCFTLKGPKRLWQFPDLNVYSIFCSGFCSGVVKSFQGSTRVSKWANFAEPRPTKFDSTDLFVIHTTNCVFTVLLLLGCE